MVFVDGFGGLVEGIVSVQERDPASRIDKTLSLFMSSPSRRPVQVVVVLLCKVGDVGIYGKRRDVESGVLTCVGIFRGELYCDGMVLRFGIDRTGRSEDRTEPSVFLSCKARLL